MPRLILKSYDYNTLKSRNHAMLELRNYDIIVYIK